MPDTNPASARPPVPGVTHLATDVAIVGGGPTGLMLAIELGCRGVRCVVVEEDAGPAPYPKANANSARTMEHYRRRGFAQRIRALGLPAEHAQDVVYRTRYAGTELARLRLPSRAQAARRELVGDLREADWPTPELPHRAQQMFVEPVLWDEAGRWPGVELRPGWQVTEVRDGPDAALVLARGTAGATSGGTTASTAGGGELQELQISAGCVVGCEGARSIVRAAIGAQLEGEAGAVREFFGGQMCGVYLRSTELAAIAAAAPAWQTWVSNAERRGIVMAIDGVSLFIVGFQLAPGQTKDEVDVQAVIEQIVGRRFACEVLGINSWLAGYTLVADRYASASGRLFIAGDAAHLFTPAAGMGYNTAIDDAVNLGWKLAAVIQGWAGAPLLASYEDERRPIGLRNTAYARAMADSMGRLRPPPGLEAEGEEGDAARRNYGAACAEHLHREYDIPGLQLGLRYVSDVIAREPGTAPPADDPVRYVPSGYPGVRAPHLVPADAGAGSILDLFGRDFTLLCPDPESAPALAWRDAAAQRRVPLSLLRWLGDDARRLYGAEFVLVRPDHHIAWRGGADANADGVLALALALPATATGTAISAGSPVQR